MNAGAQNFKRQLETLTRDFEVGDNGAIVLTKPLKASAFVELFNALIPHATDFLPDAVRDATGAIMLRSLMFEPATAQRDYALNLSLEWDAPAHAQVSGTALGQDLKLKMGRIALEDRGGRITGFAEAELEIFDFVADVRVSFPTLEIDGFLRPDASLDSAAFAREHKLLLPGKRGKPTPKIEDLEIHAAPKTGDLSLHVAVSDLLDLAPFEISELEADIKYQSGNAPDISVFAELAINLPDAAGKAVTCAFDLSGGYSGSAAHFAATLRDDTPIRIGAVANALAHHPIADLPKVVADAQVTALGVSFDETDTFRANLSFELPDLRHLAVELRLTSGPQGSEVSGHILIAGLVFDIDFKKLPKSATSASGSMILAALSVPTGIHLQDVVDAISPVALPVLPIDLDLKDAAFAYLSGGGNAVQGEADKTGQSRKFARLDVDSDLNIAALKSLGLSSGQAGKLGDVSVGYAFEPFDKDDLDALNTWFATINIPALPEPKPAAQPEAQPANDVALDGLTLRGNIDLGGMQLPIEAGTAPEAKQPSPTDAGSGDAAATGGAVGHSAESSNAKWFALQKALGPLYFDKLGVNYTKGRLWFLLNASVALGPLSLGLLSAGIGVRVADGAHDVFRASCRGSRCR